MSRSTKSNSSPISGFVLLYKPVGPGSQKLLGTVRRVAGTRRVGHCGTLDPFASGLLPIAVGRATRLVDRVHQFPKTYEADLQLGVETDTLDLEGAPNRSIGPPPVLSPEGIEACLQSLRGPIRQVPPAFSAARIAGQRAYQLARRGQDLTIASRSVEVYDLSLTSVSTTAIGLRVTCSSGTYVRALGRDIAQALGTDGHLTRLVRTQVGPFSLRQAVTSEELERLAARLGIGSLLVSPEVLYHHSPAVVLSADQAALVRNGAPIPSSHSLPIGTMVRAYEDGELLALMTSAESTLTSTLLLK